MKIRAVLFDLDETLIEEESSNDAAAIAACALAAIRHGIDRDALFRAIREQSLALWLGGPMIDYCRNIGISSREGLWGAFSSDDPGSAKLRDWIPEYRRRSWLDALRHLGIDDESLAAELAHAFMIERRARHVVFSESRQVLHQLKRSHRLALITNGASDIQREKIVGAGLAPFFDAIVISGSLGFGKPNPEIFATALRHLNVAPDETVMVGDSLSRDIEGARTAGIKTIWINRFARPRHDPRKIERLDERDRYHAPDAELIDLRQLPSIIAGLD